VVAILTINRSTYSSFQSTVALLAGKAQIEITNGAAGVPQELLTELEVIPGVAAIAGVVQEFVRVPALNGRQVCLLGVDLLQQSAIWEGEFEKEGFISGGHRRREGAGSVLVRDALREAGLSNGDTLTTLLHEVARSDSEACSRTSASHRSSRVRRDHGSAASQMTFVGRAPIGSIALRLGPTRFVLRRAARVKGRGEVVSPATRGKRVEAMLFVNRWLLSS
jgi:hypothetical protein